MINSKMSAEAATPLVEMLENGRLVANEAMEGTETRVQAVHYADDRPSYLRIGPNFWAEGSDAAAFTLSHDYGHVIQKERLGLIYDPSSTMTLSQWNLLTATPKDGGPGQAFFEATQADANRFACSVTIYQTGYHQRFCE